MCLYDAVDQCMCTHSAVSAEMYMDHIPYARACHSCHYAVVILRQLAVS